MATSTTVIGLHVGDLVHPKDDPRHLGQVQAVINGLVRIKWEGTCWVSDEEPRNLERVVQ